MCKGKEKKSSSKDKEKKEEKKSSTPKKGDKTEKKSTTKSKRAESPAGNSNNLNVLASRVDLESELKSQPDLISKQGVPDNIQPGGFPG